MKNIYVAGIVQHEDKFLMLHHKGIKKWVFSGGKPECEETGVEATQREMKEELGICVNDLTLHSTHVHEVNGEIWTGLFYTVGRWLGRIKVAEPTKHSEVRWVRWSDIETQPERSIAESIVSAPVVA